MLGVGLGSDRFGHEFSGTGEECDDRRRAAMLDEHLTVLDAAWSGAPVHHRGEHYVLDGLTFRPAPPDTGVDGRVPGTAPGRCAAPRPGTASSPSTCSTPTELAAVAAALDELRGGSTGPFDLVVGLPVAADVAAFAAAGATWWLTDFDPATVTVDEVRGVLRDGPA